MRENQIWSIKGAEALHTYELISRSLMALSRLKLLVAALLASPALAGNHFAGIGASNSKGGTSSYTCRTQAQVLWCPSLLNSFGCTLIASTLPVELTRQRRQRARFRGPPNHWFRMQRTQPGIGCRCRCWYQSTCRHMRFCQYENAFITPIGSYYLAYLLWDDTDQVHCIILMLD